MTKEEAKLVLDNARPQTKEIDRQFYDDEDLNNALDMAIKALEQKPCEDCVVEDLINQVNEQGNKKITNWLDNFFKMEFPKTFDEFANDYGFTDDKEIYTNGSHLIPVFRVKQWLDHIEQQPSDDCVSRKAVLNTLFYKSDNNCEVVLNKELQNRIKALPPITPTQSWIPLVWDEYPTVDIDGNDDYVYAVDYSVPMPDEDEWVLITDENHNVRTVQYDGYDFGDYVREEILAWKHSPNPYIE